MRLGSLPGVTWMAPAFVGQIAFPGERPGRRPRTTAGEGQGFAAGGQLRRVAPGRSP